MVWGDQGAGLPVERTRTTQEHAYFNMAFRRQTDRQVLGSSVLDDEMMMCVLQEEELSVVLK